MIEKCNHNIEDKETTILFNSTKRNMCYPNTTIGICKECQKRFKLTRYQGYNLQAEDGDANED
jgi:hypothetical protein